MIYIVSDLHGYPIDKWKALLAKANFSKKDTLYVLGDVIDRGKDGVNLLKWMKQQPNVQPILGNHEQMMLECSFLYEKEKKYLALEQRRTWSEWKANGGAPTMDALHDMSLQERGELFEYVKSFPCYCEVSCSGKKYIFTHSGINHFRPDKLLTMYKANDFLWHRPKIKDSYFEDKTMVFGHTPTLVFGSEFAGKIYRSDTWIDIDAGAAYGFSPLLIRLNDWKTFSEN